eukprot:gnl/Spiro4/11506_TR6074_c0_g1_i1.p1 gnl/Spiro4/11506_TR6074_c0_g1~~gnl/Spiro4/11506_TR6074_c0_g1_i1.p1  ORF type:complete len:629 (-),score=129.27 gnl/Spiro4/11506_TR6074_c0_g1_i1:33-1919(-)
MGPRCATLFFSVCLFLAVLCTGSALARRRRRSLTSTVTTTHLFPERHPSKHYDVIVVGGGLSGLYAAHRLAYHHFVKKILVLEARNRVGGRTYSPLVETKIGRVSKVRRDKGAEFTSPTARRLMALQDRYELHRSLVYDENPMNFMDSDGEIHKSGFLIPVPLPFFSLPSIARGLLKFTRMMKTINLEHVHLSEEAEKLDAMSLEQFVAPERGFFPDNKVAREFFVVTMEVMYGTPAKDISMLQLLHFVKSCFGMGGLRDSGRWHIRGGAQQVSVGLAGEGGFDLALNTEVTEISQNEEGVTVVARHDLKKHIEDYHSGSLMPLPHNFFATQELDEEGSMATETFSATYVVLAVPLPFAHKIKYTPEMPEGRTKLTANSYMATYHKLHIACEKRTWNFTGGFNSNGPVPIFADTSHPADDKMDTAQITAFFVPPSSINFLATHTDEASRRAAVMNQLREQLEVPDLDTDKNRCEYNEQDWDKEGGVTLSFRHNGQNSLAKYGEYLKKPIQRMHFAGTETSYIWNGYQEGALESGERAAAEVSKRLHPHLHEKRPEKYLDTDSEWIKALEPSGIELRDLGASNTLLEKHRKAELAEIERTASSEDDFIQMEELDIDDNIEPLFSPRGDD